MDERKVRVEEGGPVLEGRYRHGSGPGAVVLCHPHPLYGGSMDNNVVETLRDCYGERNFSTLRFNFRGVGRSAGNYGDGVGEVEDLMAVYRFLQNEGHERIDLAGYSFGAWVVLKACGAGADPGRLVLVSPPVGLLDFDGIRLPPVPTLVILGDRDELAPVPAVAAWIAAAREEGQGSLERQVTLPGCDHFYYGRESAVAEAVSSYLDA